MFLNLFRLIILFTLSFNAIAQDSNSTPCTGSATLLSLIDRPTVGFSACVVPEKQILIESGYQYSQLHNSGVQQNIPNLEIRVGIPNQFELDLFAPNYIQQSVDPRIGFGPSAIGIKHIIGANSKSVLTLFGMVIPSSGSASFGSKGMGGAIMGILAYDLTEEISVSGLLSASSQTESVTDGGRRFSSINPDLVVSWNKDKVSFYGEVYGQSKTGPEEGSGFNMDIGLIYLIKKNISIDVEFGKRINGSLGNFNQYLGTGLTILFS